MPDTYDAQYEQDVTEQAKGLLASYVQGIKESMGTSATGASAPSDEELGAFFFKQMSLYPPQLFVYPDGHQVFASPWILALEFCSNGNEWLAKWMRFQQKAMVS